MNKDFLKLAIKNLLLLLFIVAFVVCFSAILGTENQLIGVALITGLIMFYNIDLGLNKKQAPFIIIGMCLLMAIGNIVSFYNIYLAIIVNFAIIFIFMTLSTVHLEYKTYIPFALMYIFADGMPIEENQILKRFLSFFISGILLAILYYIKHKKLENGKTIKEIYKNISIYKETTVFNIKMALGVTIAMFLIAFFNIEKGFWISVTVMSLTQPHFHMTKEKIKHRFLGTIVGFICFLILFGGIIPEQYLGILAGILSYIYTFVKSYYVQIIFVTINALNSASGLFNTSFESGIYRISFIVLGIAIVLLTVFIEKTLDKKVKIYPDDEDNKEDKEDVLTNSN